MVEIEHIHPVLVHFVVAPLAIAVFFDFLWLVKKNDAFEKFSWYSLVISGIAAVLSVVSGLMAEENVNFPENALGVFETHENLAFLLIVFLLIQVFWRFSQRGKIPRQNSYLYFVLIMISFVLVVSTSYFGGKLVFNFGVGVRSSNSIEKMKSEPGKTIPEFQFVNPDTTTK